MHDSVPVKRRMAEYGSIWQNIEAEKLKAEKLKAVKYFFASNSSHFFLNIVSSKYMPV